MFGSILRLTLIWGKSWRNSWKFPFLTPKSQRLISTENLETLGKGDLGVSSCSSPLLIPSALIFSSLMWLSLLFLLYGVPQVYQFSRSLDLFLFHWGDGES